VQAHVCRYVAPPGELWQHYYAPIIFYRCIARFLCAMRGFKVRASSLSPRLPLCQISFRVRPPLLKPMEKNYVLNYSLTQHTWCPRNRSASFNISQIQSMQHRQPNSVYWSTLTNDTGTDNNNKWALKISLLSQRQSTSPSLQSKTSHLAQFGPLKSEIKQQEMCKAGSGR